MTVTGWENTLERLAAVATFQTSLAREAPGGEDPKLQKIPAQVVAEIRRPNAHSETPLHRQ